MSDPDGGDGQRYRLHGVERALDALELLAAAGQDGLTLTELAQKIAVSKSSAFALLQTLMARGFVADSGTRLSRRYRLGMALAKLGDAAESQSPLISLAVPVMQSVTDATGLTTRLVTPDGPLYITTARENFTPMTCAPSPGRRHHRLHARRNRAAAILVRCLTWPRSCTGTARGATRKRPTSSGCTRSWRRRRTRTGVTSRCTSPRPR